MSYDRKILRSNNSWRKKGRIVCQDSSENQLQNVEAKIKTFLIKSKNQNNYISNMTYYNNK